MKEMDPPDDSQERHHQHGPLTLIFPIGSLLCMCTTALLCSWAVMHLLRSRQRARRKLFWAQLLALTLVDLTSSVLYGANVCWKLLHPDRHSSKFWYNFLGMFDIYSSILELQIAIGFLGACFGMQRLAVPLRRAIAMGAVLAAMLELGVVLLRLDSHHDDQYWPPIPDKGDLLWSGVLILCCLGSAIAYAWGLFHLRHMPRLLRRRAQARAGTFALNNILTLLPVPIIDLLYYFFGQSKGLGKGLRFAWAFTGWIFYLNGAGNVLAYAFWMWKMDRSETRSHAQGGLDDVEAVVMDEYFDLCDDEDELAHLAKRSAAESVAAAHSGNAMMLQAAGVSNVAMHQVGLT